VDVSCSSTTGTESRGALGEVAKEGGRAVSSGTIGSLRGSECIACAATTRVDILAGGWVWLGELVVRHLVGSLLGGCGLCVCVGM
jgi:hypothetical protein